MTEWESAAKERAFAAPASLTTDLCTARISHLARTVA